MNEDKNREQLGDALFKLAESLPPHLQDELTRGLINEIGTDKVADALMGTITANEEPFAGTVAQIRKLGDRGEKLLEYTMPFLGSLRDSGKDFHECWAAMTMMLAISANSNALGEMLGYCLTWITFNRHVPATPDTPETAAAKAKAARSVADEFLDLANALRDERGQ